MATRPTAPKDVSSAVEPRIAPWAALAFSNYRLLWTAGLVGGFGLQMRNFANVWQVYEITGSSLQLGLTGLFQVTPLFTLGLFAGTLADIVDRRTLLIISHTFNLVLTLLLAFLTATHHVQVWHIYVVTAMASAVNVFGQPARVSLITNSVPKTHLMNAINLNTMVQRAATVVGPAIAGVLVAAAGPAIDYFVNAALFVPVLFCVAAVRVPAIRGSGARRFQISHTVEGFRFVLMTPVLISLILLDSCATLFGSYRALMPVFAKDILQVGPAGLGLLFSGPAFGSLTGTLGLLGLGNVRRKGALVLMSTLLYACAFAVLGFSHWFYLSLGAAVGLGLFDSMGHAARQVTVQLTTPENLRGRTTSVHQMFEGGFPSLGYVLAGFMASMLGAPHWAMLGGCVIAAIVVLVTIRNPALRTYRM